ncbi:hypothetical protein, partial [Ramlibacter sp.]|uniref:hypothetical protein n=1 Tax=Ramlibacter sp. TaxID=1917967 RepID=UPI003D12C5B3
ADPQLTPAEKVTARLDTQNALAAVLKLADMLKARQAHEWAKDAYAAASEEIAAGELAYREQRFPAALRAYAEATKQLLAIEKGIPDIVANFIDEGERALQGTDGVAAVQAFERALALAPDHKRAQEGLRRASALDRVLALIAEAQGYEKIGDTDRARSAYREALTLDSQASEATQALERIERERVDKAYARAMSAGYQALEAQRFDAAKESFQHASTLKPQSNEAANALQQTALRASAARIEQTLKAATNHERAERWNEAAGQYRAALALDGQLDAAKLGLSRASARAAIDIEMEKTLARAERLGDEAVYGQAQALLTNARAVAAPGPKLQRQIGALATAIKHYRTPVTVTLHSDGQTAVSVSRAGTLAPFVSQQLTLLAGRYTATGKRDGYRDVRVEFTVDPAAPPPAVDVRCTEVINF